MSHIIWPLSSLIWLLSGKVGKVKKSGTLWKMTSRFHARPMGIGHAVLRVTLKSGLYEDDWCVQPVIHVEAGQLEELAEKVKRFLHVERAS
jgi:hypothetical protein